MFLGLDLTKWGVVSEIATAAVAVIALALGIPAWVRNRRALKREIVNELFKEYSSEAMGMAIKSLHDAFRKSTGKRAHECINWVDRRKWIDYYKRLYKKKSLGLHYARRMVSSFYQRIAFAAKGSFVRRVVLEMWGEKNHPFVMNVLLPIETVAMPELLSDVHYSQEVPAFNYKYPMWRMFHFWKRAQPIQWWRFRTNLKRSLSKRSPRSDKKAPRVAHAARSTDQSHRVRDGRAGS